VSISPTEAKHIAVCLPNMGGGGAERVALEITEDLLGAGHAVDLVLVEAQGELMPLVPNGTRIIDLKSKRMRSALAPLTRYLREEQPDAMQVSMWPLTAIAIAARLLSRSPTRIVTSDHISYVHASALDRMIIGLTIRLLYPFADRRIVVSDLALRDLAELAGMSPDRFDLVYNPVALPRDICSRPEVEALWQGANRRILTVGSLKRAKNHALLLRAFARLQDPEARLIILGEGPLREDLLAQAKMLGIADQLVMPGFAIDPWPFYASADLFVLSSDWEGLPLVLIEALAAGLPVVSTNCESGPAEILDGGRFGVLVPTGDETALADAMAAALQRPTESAALKRRAASLSQGAALRYRELLLGTATHYGPMRSGHDHGNIDLENNTST